MKTVHVTRRSFLKASAAVAAAGALPQWFVENSAVAATPEPRSPNDQPAIALIGCGGMGRGLARSSKRFGRVVALCDVDDARVAEAKKDFPEAETFKDFRKVTGRKDIDVVLCGTVDHWHTLISIAAMRAGKDVYCEKPLTLTIDEGKRLVAGARETKRILQTGSQQRSEGRFRLACELVRNGRIGQVRQVTTVLPAGRRDGPFQPSPVPEGLDWDLWLGQTPQVEYVRQRVHGSFRYWYEYSGGTMTDWGAHHNDIALWGLGLDRSGPVSIEGRPLVEMIPDGFNAHSEYHVDYVYANGVRHTCRSTRPGDKEDRHGVRFEGENGWIWVTRGEIQAGDPALLSQPLPADAERLYVSNDHMGNFFECIRTRRQPICEAEIGHRAASLCHLGVIAIRLGRKLEWDPAREQFGNDSEANAMVAREMRKPWSYDSV